MRSNKYTGAKGLWACTKGFISVCLVRRCQYRSFFGCKIHLTLGMKNVNCIMRVTVVS
jgi:hypothetical protein